MDRDALSYLHNTFILLLKLYGEEKAVKYYKVIYGTAMSGSETLVADGAVEAFANLTLEDGALPFDVRTNLTDKVVRFGDAIRSFVGGLNAVCKTFPDSHQGIVLEEQLLSLCLLKLVIQLNNFCLKLHDKGIGIDELAADLHEVVTANFVTKGGCDAVVDPDCVVDGCRKDVEGGNAGDDSHGSSCAGSGCKGESFNPTTQGGAAKEAQ